MSKAPDAAGLLRLLRFGGHIVSTGELPEIEIARARACGRMWVDADHFGYVFLPPPPVPVYPDKVQPAATLGATRADATLGEKE